MITNEATTPETAYRALSYAAEQIGRNNWARHVQKYAGRRQMPRYNPTPAHRDVVAAMLQVMNDELSVNDAMALLWRSDVGKERWGKS